MTAQEREFAQLLAFVFLQNARPHKAATLLAALDALAPGDRRTLQGLALAQIRCGRGEEALETVERFAIAGGADPAYQLLRSRALMLENRRVEASEAMQGYIGARRAAFDGSGRVAATATRDK